MDLSGIDGFINEIGNFIPEIEQQLQTVADTIADVKKSQDQILEDVLGQLNLADQLGAVNDFWTDIKGQVGGIESQLENLADTVETQVPGMARYVAIGLYVIGGLFVLMTVIALLICARLLSRGFMLRLYSTFEIAGMSSYSLSRT